SSCSINKLAINAVSNALTGSGSSDVFTSDSDPKLVGDALPFAIKMYEALLSVNPGHHGLMVTTGSLFVMYSNAYVHGPAEMLPSDKWQEREAEMDRAKKLYLRGHEILYDALDSKFNGFRKASVTDGSLEPILQKCKKEDAGLLYWAVAGGMAAYSIDVFDFELSGNIPNWTAMIQRAYELDPDYGGASLDEFFIIFYSSLPEMMGGDKEKAQRHFRRALEKTNGNSTSAYISYAQSISVPAQDYDTFTECLEKALAVDPNADPSVRLMTIINQKKARWLLDNAYNFFSFIPMPDDYYLDNYFPEEYYPEDY
ncbi:MAG: TRAP transporter TatT component family protein, partial [Treponema sp.]|nr:TRAP transporter TatT component family protein [Treponema sp.]